MYTLTGAQRNYAQMEKEAFSIIFGLKRLHQFLYGRKFQIITDHKPLLTLLGPYRPVPTHVAACLKRWALILASYNYELVYRNTAVHSDNHGKSRLPLHTTWDPKYENISCYFLESDIGSAVTSAQIRQKTRVDPVLSRAHSYTVNGWPTEISDPPFMPYSIRKAEPSVEQGCVLRGARVIVPSVLQEQMLTELRETHPGTTKTKAIARSFVWWPGIDILTS